MNGRRINPASSICGQIKDSYPQTKRREAILCADILLLVNFSCPQQAFRVYTRKPEELSSGKTRTDEYVCGYFTPSKLFMPATGLSSIHARVRRAFPQRKCGLMNLCGYFTPSELFMPATGAQDLRRHFEDLLIDTLPTCSLRGLLPADLAPSSVHTSEPDDDLLKHLTA